MWRATATLAIWPAARVDVMINESAKTYLESKTVKESRFSLDSPHF